MHIGLKSIREDVGDAADVIRGMAANARIDDLSAQAYSAIVQIERTAKTVEVAVTCTAIILMITATVIAFKAAS